MVLRGRTGVMTVPLAFAMSIFRATRYVRTVARRCGSNERRAATAPADQGSRITVSVPASVGNNCVSVDPDAFSSTNVSVRLASMALSS